MFLVEYPEGYIMGNLCKQTDLIDSFIYAKNNKIAQDTLIDFKETKQKKMDFTYSFQEKPSS